MTNELEVFDRRSLVDLCLDLVELDQSAPENKELVEARLNQLGQKVSSYCMIDDFSDTQIAALQKEVEFLEKQIKNYKTLKTKLRERAMFVMNTMGVKSLKGDNGHKMTIKETTSVDVSSVKDLPDHLLRFVPASKEPDKLAIKEAIKAGEKVLGATLVINKTVSLT